MCLKDGLISAFTIIYNDCIVDFDYFCVCDVVEIKMFLFLIILEHKRA